MQLFRLPYEVRISPFVVRGSHETCGVWTDSHTTVVQRFIYLRSTFPDVRHAPGHVP